MIIKPLDITSYSIESGNKELPVLLGLPQNGSKHGSGGDFGSVITATQADGEKAAGQFGDAFVVFSPGEYNIGGSYIYGVPFDGGTMYSAAFADDITVGYIAVKSKKQLDDSVLELLGSIDLLLIYVDSANGITPDAAETIVGQIEPSFVVPMGDNAEDLSAFFKNLGQEQPAAEKSLKITSAQLDDEVLQVALLQ